MIKYTWLFCSRKTIQFNSSQFYNSIRLFEISSPNFSNTHNSSHRDTFPFHLFLLDMWRSWKQWRNPWLSSRETQTDPIQGTGCSHGPLFSRTEKRTSRIYRIGKRWHDYGKSPPDKRKTHWLCLWPSSIARVHIRLFQVKHHYGKSPSFNGKIHDNITSLPRGSSGSPTHQPGCGYKRMPGHVPVDRRRLETFAMSCGIRNTHKKNVHQWIRLREQS